MPAIYEKVLTQSSGEPFTDRSGAPLTLQGALIQACDLTTPYDERMSPLERFAVSEAGMAVQRGEELLPDQKITLAARVTTVYLSAGMVSRIVQALFEVEQIPDDVSEKIKAKLAPLSPSC